MWCLDGLAGLFVTNIALTILVWFTSSSRPAVPTQKVDDFQTILRALSPRLERLHNAGLKMSVVLDPGSLAWDTTYYYDDHVGDEDFFLRDKFDLDFEIDNATPFDAESWIAGCIPDFLKVRVQA